MYSAFVFVVGVQHSRYEVPYPLSRNPLLWRLRCGGVIST